MNTKHLILTALPVSTLSMILAACGGGSSSGDSSNGGSSMGDSSGASNSSSAGSASGSASIAGIYSGVNTVAGVQEEEDILALPDGSFIGLGINQSNGCGAIDLGSVSLTGTSFKGSLETTFISSTVGSLGGITAGCTYPDGSPSSSGTITGTLTPGTSINVTVAATTGAGTVLPSEMLTLPVSSLYAEPGPLAKIAGTYAGASNQTLTIGADGTAVLQDSISGCTVNAKFSVVGDASHDLYSATATFSNCQGADAPLNGQTSSNGIFTLDDTTTPAVLKGGVTVTNSGVTYVIAFFAAKQ